MSSFIRYVRRHHIGLLDELFIALGGTSYAAVALPANSIGTKQIKKNAVTGVKVKNGSLRVADFKAGQLPAGPRGAAGAPGAKGDKGDPGTNGANGANGATRSGSPPVGAYRRGGRSHWVGHCAMSGG